MRKTRHTHKHTHSCTHTLAHARTHTRTHTSLWLTINSPQPRFLKILIFLLTDKFADSKTTRDLLVEVDWLSQLRVNGAWRPPSVAWVWIPSREFCIKQCRPPVLRIAATCCWCFAFRAFDKKVTKNNGRTHIFWFEIIQNSFFVFLLTDCLEGSLDLGNWSN